MFKSFDFNQVLNDINNDRLKRLGRTDPKGCKSSKKYVLTVAT